MEMTDSTSQSDDTSGGGGSSNGGGGGGVSSHRPSSRPRNPSGSSTSGHGKCRRKGTLNAKERNLRRLESNERERMRMHSLNDAFQVGSEFTHTHTHTNSRSCLFCQCLQCFYFIVVCSPCVRSFRTWRWNAVCPRSRR